MNFLSLAGKGYENAARGILYVLYEIVWKLTYYVLSLIDEITKLFYKVAGINVVDGVVEKASIIDQLLGQSAITTAYVILLIFALGLVLIFSLVTVVKSMAKEEHKSLGPLFKNMGLAFLLLAVMGPIVLLIISIVSNLAVWIASLGGGNSISIADAVFTNSGNLIESYNSINATEFTSFRELGNGFLYDLMYYTPGEGEPTINLAYHWYISLLGGAFVLYNLALIVFDMVKRLFNIVILYVASPFAVSKMVLDDGKSFKEWQSKLIYEFILLLTQIGTFMVFVALVNVLNNINFEALASSEGLPEDTGGLGDIYEPTPGTPEVTPPSSSESTFSLLNGVGRTLIIMAAVNVTRTSATMIAELLKGKETKTDALLENVLSKMSSRSGQPVTRTRTITKNTTTTKRETVFVEAQPSNQGAFSGGAGASDGSKSHDKINNITNNITQNVNVNNKFTTNNTLANRVPREGITKGSYGGEKVSPSVVYINATKTAEISEKSTKEWKMMENSATKIANTMIKDYNSASSNFSNAINSNDNAQLKKSFENYAKAYSKEAEILADNYRKFEKQATNTMTSEISKQTKEELKNISSSYRKAQMDYAKTASKLQKMNGERMSTSQALKLKEQADKQRERLMSASNKAAHFYENQKKGE